MFLVRIFKTYNFVFSMTIHFTNFLESDPEFENIVYFDRVYALKCFDSECCLLLCGGKRSVRCEYYVYRIRPIIKLPNAGEEGRFLSLL